MCTVCGCEQDSQQSSQQRIDFGNNEAGLHIPGLSSQKVLEIEKDVLGRNDGYAKSNRNYFEDHGVFTLNLLSSPGAGKTTLLVKTLRALSTDYPCCVIEGDQQTSEDADAIRETGVKAIQINTGKGCHLDAHMISHAIEKIGHFHDGFLFIENVGNLVCPANYDLGEHKKVVMLSVTEGHNKPIKYPDMFHAADLLLITKTDLLPYVNFDIEQAINYAQQINPELITLTTSTVSHEGLESWYHWLHKQLNSKLTSVSL